MERFAPIASLMDRLSQTLDIPACGCAAAIDGQVVFRHAAGFSDPARTVPASLADTYWIYSATKLTTCTAALRLLERGALSLSAPVARYLPAFGSLTVRGENGAVRPAKNVLRVEHLLTMTGGFDYDLTRPALQAAISDPRNGTQEIVAALAREPLCFEPGSHFLYSMCHDILAAVVEAASGQRFADYVRENITGPLGMADTTFHPTPTQLRRLSTQYAHTGPGGSAELVSQGNHYLFTPGYDSGGAGLMSTVEDYIRLPAALSCGGRAFNGYQVLRPETVALMAVPRLTGAAQQDFLARSAADHAFSYGLGVRVLVDGRNTAGTVGQFGWDGAAGAFIVVDPVHRAALFYAQQVRLSGVTFQRLHPALRELFGACLTGREPTLGPV